VQMEKKNYTCERKKMVFNGSVGVVADVVEGDLTITYSNPAQNEGQSNGTNKSSESETGHANSTVNETARNETDSDAPQTENKQCLFTSEIQNYVLKQLDDAKFSDPANPFVQLSGGKTDAQVFLIDIVSRSSNLTGLHIIKLTEHNVKQTNSTEDSVKSQNVFRHCNDEFKEHLVDSDIYHHENVQIIRCDHALLDRHWSKNLCDTQLQLNKKAKYVSMISEDLLTKWNKDCKVDTDVQSFFTTLLKEYVARGSKFNKLIKLLLVNPERKAIKFPFSRQLYPNPYYYITHTDELIALINLHWQPKFISGKIHGDLHAQNIICDSHEASYKYALIDYTYYTSDSFVLCDHAMLEVDNYWRILKNKTQEDWKQQSTLINARINDTVTSSNGNYHGTLFTYDQELLQFRNAVCTGITSWQLARYSRNFNNIEIQFACARIVAGIRAFSFLSRIRKKQNNVITEKDPFENFEECVLLFYYTTICLDNLFQNIVSDIYEKWECDEHASLNAAYIKTSDNIRKLVWQCKRK